MSAEYYRSAQVPEHLDPLGPKETEDWSEWDEPLSPEERDALEERELERAVMPAALELALSVALRTADSEYATSMAKLTELERAPWPREASLIPIPRGIVLALLHLYGTQNAPTNGHANTEH
jgi:hypothetical protein